MAKRKLNLTFLVILGLVIVGLAGTGYVVYRLRTRIKPETVIARAKEYEEKKNYTEAGKWWRGLARELKPNDPSAWVTAADSQIRLASVERDNYVWGREAYRQALQLDPRYLPALRPLVKLLREEAETEMIASGQLDLMIDLARRLVELDPTDVDAPTTADLGLLLKYQGSTELENADADAAIERLGKRADEASDPVDPAYFAARAQLIKSVRLTPLNPTAARQLLNTATAAFRQRVEKVKETPEAMLASVKIELLGLSTERDAGQRVERVKNATAIADATAKAVKPEAGLVFVEAKMLAADLNERQGNSDVAEQYYRDVLAAMPYAASARKALGDIVLRRDGPDKAIEIYNGTPTDLPPIAGLVGRNVPLGGPALQIAVMRAKLDKLNTVSDAAARASQLDAIDQQLKGAIEQYSLDPQNPQILRVRGAIEMARNRTSQALNTFNRALGVVRSSDNRADAQLRLELQLLMAQANLKLQQNGTARDLLEDVLRQLPEYLPARELLATLYLDERNFAAAKTQIDLLRKARPDEARFKQMEERLLVTDRDEVVKRYVKLPEADKEQRTAKLRAAVTIRDYNEIIHLCKLLLAEDPKNADVVMVLASAYAETGDRATAVDILNTYLAANPDQERVKNLLGSMQQFEPAQVQAELEKIANPFVRSMKLYYFFRDQGKPEEALKALLAAYQQDDGSQAADLLFSEYVRRGDFTSAEPVLKKLSDANADQAQGRLYRAQMLMAQGKSAEAIALASSVTNELPELTNGWVALGRLSYTAAQYDTAADAFMQAVQRSPTNQEALHGVIDSLYAANRFQQAKSFIDKGRSLNSADLSFRQNELVWELTHGSATRLIASREQLVNDRPNDPDAWVGLGLAYAGASRKATVDDKDAEAKKLLGQASDTFKKAIEKFPEDIRFVGYFADVSRQLGTPEAGIAALTKFVARDSQKGRPQAVLVLTELFNSSGNPQGAVEPLKAYLAANPGPQVQVRIRLARLLRLANQVDEAIAVLVAGGNDRELRREQIETLLNGERLDDARKLVAETLAADPTAEGHVLAALTELRANNREAAIAAIEKAFALQPDNSAALYYRAVLRATAPTPDIAGALADLRKVRDQLPNNLEARTLLGELLGRTGETPAAIAEFEAIRKITPAERSVVLKLAELYSRSTPPQYPQAEKVLRETRDQPGLSDDPELLNAEAVVLLTQGKGPAAEPLIRLAAKKAPQSEPVAQTLLDVILANGKYDEALRLADAGLKTSPDSWWRHAIRGGALARLKKPADAQAAFKTAFDLTIKAGPSGLGSAQRVLTIAVDLLGTKPAAEILAAYVSDPGWALVLAGHHQRRGEPAPAIQLIEPVLADRSKLAPPQLEAALRLAGDLYQQIQPPNLEKAYAAYKDLIGLQPDDIAALNNIAFLLVMPGAPGGGPTEALTYSQRAYDRLSANGATVNPFVADTHAWVLVLAGRLDDAAVILERIRDTAPFPEALYHLAEAYSRRDQKDLAKNTLQSAYKLLDTVRRQGQDVTAITASMNELAGRLGVTVPTTAPARQPAPAAGR